MIARRLLASIAAALLAGCSELPKPDPAKAGPFYTPSNVTRRSAQLPEDLRRVLVLPSSSVSAVPEESLVRLDEAILAELNRTGRFETVTVRREELRELFGSRAFSSTEALPADLFSRLARRYAADGVLFTDITQLNAYPPLSLGLRFKLARLSDREVIWAADNQFSAADPAVSNAARRHALALGADRSPGDLSYTILQNPSRFAGYAAAETFATLPSR